MAGEYGPDEEYQPLDCCYWILRAFRRDTSANKEDAVPKGGIALGQRNVYTLKLHVFERSATRLMFSRVMDSDIHKTYNSTSRCC